MTSYRCVSCKGTYSDTNEDGSRYYHTCPSSIAARLRRDENIDAATGKARLEGGGVQKIGV